MELYELTEIHCECYSAHRYANDPTPEYPNPLNEDLPRTVITAMLR